MRIKVLSKNREEYIEFCQNKGCEQKRNLLEILQENHIDIRNSCYGNGTCGKCKVKVIAGYLPITEADGRCLTKEKLEKGVRLACKAKVGQETEELWIEIVAGAEEDIIIEGIDKQTKENVFNMPKNYFIAIDIGTTTIAMALVNEETGDVCDIYTSLNHQRKYGADIISRITAANDGKAEELKKLIEEALCRGIGKLTGVEAETEIEVNDIKMNGYRNDGKINLTRIIIAGNTTMIHLLMGYSCKSLGKYPFESEYLGKIECELKDCLSKNVAKRDRVKERRHSNADDVYHRYIHTPVTIFPGISAFVGGDVVAGILACGGFETKEISLLIDLGTNGEMVLGNKHRIVATSTAAGPAFEGGNITCGTASVPGGICRVKIQNQRAIVRTIRNELPPVGICGTGLISAIAQLIKNQLANEEGELKTPYQERGVPLWTFENGEKIALYQNDIREFQMAKAAIRAGIDIIMEEYGCTSGDVKNVYIAGGFGKALNIEDVLSIGMMPEDFKDKINIVGNSALQGAVCCGKDSKCIKQAENICQKVENILLSEKEEFQKKYLQYMKLRKDNAQEI